VNAAAKGTHAGQAAYDPWVLRIYDWYVLGLSNRWIWRCPTARIVDHYDRHVRARHLDVGVGSGYLLDRCRFPVERPQVTLMDLNRNSLEHTARRIARYQPTIHRGDVLELVDLPRGNFGSIGVNYLMHCLPGDIEGGKWRAFEHLAPLMTDDGVLFGSTILGEPAPKGLAQRRLMDIYNRKGIFGNDRDSIETLRKGLEESFEDVEIELEGVVALFSARGPRGP
jgi:SAM-dependent methyltransferase